MSEFTWLNKQGVASNTGYSLQSVARFEWEYREGDSAFRLFGEPTFGGRHGFAFARDWDPIPTDAQREHVQRNVSEAMRFMELKAEFD